MPKTTLLETRPSRIRVGRSLEDERAPVYTAQRPICWVHQAQRAWPQRVSLFDHQPGKEQPPAQSQSPGSTAILCLQLPGSSNDRGCAYRKQGPLCCNAVRLTHERERISSSARGSFGQAPCKKLAGRLTQRSLFTVGIMITSRCYPATSNSQLNVPAPSTPMQCRSWNDLLEYKTVSKISDSMWEKKVHSLRMNATNQIQSEDVRKTSGASDEVKCAGAKYDSTGYGQTINNVVSWRQVDLKLMEETIMFDAEGRIFMFRKPRAPPRLLQHWSRVARNTHPDGVVGTTFGYGVV